MLNPQKNSNSKPIGWPQLKTLQRHSDTAKPKQVSFNFISFSCTTFQAVQDCVYNFMKQLNCELVQPGAMIKIHSNNGNVLLRKTKLDKVNTCFMHNFLCSITWYIRFYKAEFTDFKKTVEDSSALLTHHVPCFFQTETFK